MVNCRLYLITPSYITDVTSFLLKLKDVLGAGDVAYIQLRFKNTREDILEKVIDTLYPIVQRQRTILLLNDQLGLARWCDGVHLGQKDTSFEVTRRTLGERAIIGVTCHNSRSLGIIAAKKGASYVAFGAFFPSITKHPKIQVPLSLITWWVQTMDVPCVAIGGITIENCSPIVQAGANFIAVNAGIWEYPSGPATAVERLSAILSASH